MKKVFLFTTILSVGIGFNSCQKNNKSLTFASNGKTFKSSVFETELKNRLNGALGYTILINQNGQLKETAASGLSTSNVSGSSTVAASIYHDINIASVTKAFTGMAVIKVMNAKGILKNFPIGPYLPNSWQKNNAISNITFEELLTHTSGIRESKTAWVDLKDVVANPLEGAKVYSYSNVNFALFRALLPKMYDAAFFNQKEQALSTTNFESWMSNKYISIMQELVFTPAGVNNAICDETDGVVTIQAFNEQNNPPLVPRTYGNWTERCAGGGFYLSPYEMAKVMAYLAHTQSILTNAQKTFMDANLFGWDSNDSFYTTYGRVYGKDGALFTDNNGSSNVDAGDSGLQTWVGKFPNNVEVTLTVHSLNNGWRSLSTIVKQAYEASWTE